MKLRANGGGEEGRWSIEYLLFGWFVVGEGRKGEVCMFDVLTLFFFYFLFFFSSLFFFFF